MKRISLILVIISFVAIYAQQYNIPSSPNEYNADGKREGKWTILLDSNFAEVTDTAAASFYRLINFRNGKPEGKVFDYYITGELQGSAYMASVNPDVVEDSLEVYAKDGKIIRKANIIEDSLNKIITYYPSGAKALEEISSKNLNGSIKYFFEDGRCEKEEVYEASTLRETWWYYYENNTLIHKHCAVIPDSIFKVVYFDSTETISFGGYMVKHGDRILADRDIIDSVLAIEDYSEAIKYFEKLLDLYKYIYPSNLYPDGHENLAQIFHNYGSVWYELSDYPRAKFLIQNALQIREKIYNKESNLKSQYNLASSLMMLGLVSKELISYNKSDSLLKIASNMFEQLYPSYAEDLAKCYNNLGYLYQNLAKFSEAESYFKKSLSVFYEIYPEREYPDGHINIAGVYNNLGSLYENKGDFSNAISYYFKALEIYNRNRIRNSQYASILGSLGGAFCSVGKYKKAEEKYLEALDIYKNIFPKNIYPDGHVGIASLYNNIAQLYKYSSDYEKAEWYYLEAQSIYERIYKYPDYSKGHINLAINLQSLASVYEYLGRNIEAEKLLLKSFQLLKNIFPENEYLNGHPQIALIQNNLGTYYLSIGDTEKAKNYFDSAAIMYERIYPQKNHPDLAACYGNLGSVYNEMGNHKTAINYKEKSLSILKDIYPEIDFPFGHKDIALSLSNTGYSYYLINRFTEAEKFYKESIKMYKDLFPDGIVQMSGTIYNLALLYVDNNKLNEAQPLFLEALDIFKAQYESNSKSMSEKERGQFLKTLLYNFEIFNSFAVKRYEENPKILVNMLNNRLYFKSILLNTSVKIRENIMNSGNRELISLYDDFLATRRYINFFDTKSADEIQKMAVNIDSVYNAANNLEKELARLSPVFKEQSESFTFENVLDSLHSGEAYIEIIRFNYYDKDWTDTVYYAALIATSETKEHPNIVLMKNGNFLEDTLYDRFMNDIVKGRWASHRTFYDNFWKPIADNLNGIDKIYISLDGIYNKINLNTLYNPETDNYLIDELDICYISSARDFMSKERDYRNKDALIVGDPKFTMDTVKHIEYSSLYKGISPKPAYSNKVQLDDMSKWYLNELPGTEREVNIIDSLLRQEGWHTDTFLEDKALEEAVKNADKPRVLHLSTHGKFLSDITISENLKAGFISDKAMGMDVYKATEDPMLRSMLFFAGSQGTIDDGKSPEGTEDGILTAKEVMNLKLEGTELVVLSACETGLGDVKNGEGVYGLQRAFKMAGAKNLIMSLWEIPDNATQEFITLFYTKWLATGEARQSFIEAQKVMKEKYKTPRMWGGLVFIGK
jgi:CHAT domain-containing protein